VVATSGSPRWLDWPGCGRNPGTDSGTDIDIGTSID
jgi:hypothetical protein